jgi:acetyl esterase/lipase
VTRILPVPGSVSAPAQQYLATATAAARQSAAGVLPALGDLEGWRTYVRFGDAHFLERLESLARGVPAKVETTAVHDVPVFVVTPEGAPDGEDAPVLLDIHGGALVMGGGACCRASAVVSAGRAGLVTWSVDYRMPPDHPYPAGLDDCLAVYRALLERRSADRIVVGGGSAGGNLAAALVLRARDEGLPMPGALILITPEVDLTESGDSFTTNLGVDPVLISGLSVQNALYAGTHDLAHPYLSPLFGDLSVPFPPTLLQAGTRDLFLSNAVRMHRALRAGGVDAELHVFEAMPHGGFRGAPEDDDLDAEVRRFIASRVG